MKSTHFFLMLLLNLLPLNDMLCYAIGSKEPQHVRNIQHHAYLWYSATINRWSVHTQCHFVLQDSQKVWKEKGFTMVRTVGQQLHLAEHLSRKQTSIFSFTCKWNLSFVQPKTCSSNNPYRQLFSHHFHCNRALHLISDSQLCK